MSDVSSLNEATDPTGAAEPAEGQLSPEDEGIVGLLAQGMSHEQAGAQLGTSTKTIQRHLKNPAVARALGAAQRARVSQMTGALGAASLRAIVVLEDALASDDPKVAVAAARVVLDYGHRYQRAAGDDDIEARLLELEAGQEAEQQAATRRRPRTPAHTSKDRSS